MAISVHTASSCQKRTEQRSYVEKRRNQILQYRGQDPVFDFLEENRNNSASSSTQQKGNASSSSAGTGAESSSGNNSNNTAAVPSSMTKNTNNKQGVPHNDFFLVIGDNDIRTFHRTYDLTSPNIPREIEREDLHREALQIFRGEPKDSKRKAKLAKMAIEKYSVITENNNNNHNHNKNRPDHDDQSIITNSARYQLPNDILLSTLNSMKNNNNNNNNNNSDPNRHIASILNMANNGWLSDGDKSGSKFDKYMWKAWFRHGNFSNPVEEAAATAARLAEEERERRAKLLAKRAQKIRHHRVTCIHHKDAVKFSKEARQRVREKKFPQQILLESTSRVSFAKNGGETQIFGLSEAKRKQVAAQMERDEQNSQDGRGETGGANFVKNYFSTFFQHATTSASEDVDDDDDELAGSLMRNNKVQHHFASASRNLPPASHSNNNSNFTGRESRLSRPPSSTPSILKPYYNHHIQQNRQIFGKSGDVHHNKHQKNYSSSSPSSPSVGLFSMTGVDIVNNQSNDSPQRENEDVKNDENNLVDDENRVADWTRLCSCTPRSTDDDDDDDDEDHPKEEDVKNKMSFETGSISSPKLESKDSPTLSSPLHQKGIPPPKNQQPHQNITASSKNYNNCNSSSSLLVPYELSALKAKKSLDKFRRLRGEMESLRAHQLSTTLKLREETKNIMLVSNNPLARAQLEDVVAKPAERHAQQWSRSRSVMSNKTMKNLMREQTRSQLAKNFQGKESRCVSSQMGRITPIPTVWTSGDTLVSRMESVFQFQQQQQQQQLQRQFSGTLPPLAHHNNISQTPEPRMTNYYHHEQDELNLSDE